jgi:hypothetical protein
MPMPFRWPIVVLAVATASAAGCGDDTTQEAAPSPPGPPSLSIEVPPEGSCLTVDADGFMRTKIAIANWMLRPPGFCGVYEQCGFAVFFVDGQRAAESSSLATDIPVGAATPGAHTLRVELHDDDDQLALDAEGEPLRADVAFTLPEQGTPCP